MAEATNPITTASNPRVGEDVGRALAAFVAAEAERVRTIEAYNAELKHQRERGIFPPKVQTEYEAMERARCNFWTAQHDLLSVASAPTPPDRVGEEVGRELEELSKAATPGEWLVQDLKLVRSRPRSAKLLDAEGYDICMLELSDAEYASALVNAHRSGKLVASTGSGKGETKGATPMGSGHSRAEPSGLGASPECPSRKWPASYQETFDAIAAAVTIHDGKTLGISVKAFYRALSYPDSAGTPPGFADAGLSEGGTPEVGERVLLHGVVVARSTHTSEHWITVRLNGGNTVGVDAPFRDVSRVRDRSSEAAETSGSAEGKSPADLSATPKATPQSSPSQTPVDPQKAVKAFRTAALAAIQDLRHAAACNFSPAYSGSLGEARCNSFYEAYEAVRKLAPSDAPSTTEADR